MVLLAKEVHYLSSHSPVKLVDVSPPVRLHLATGYCYPKMARQISAALIATGFGDLYPRWRLAYLKPEGRSRTRSSLTLSGVTRLLLTIIRAFVRPVNR